MNRVHSVVMIHGIAYHQNKNKGIKTRVRFDRYRGFKEYIPTNTSLDRLSRLIEKDVIIPGLVWARNSGYHDGSFLISFIRKESA